MTTDIVPDDKDWTWVLQRPCDECGFDARSIEMGDVGAMLLDTDDPMYPNWDQDETAIAERYDQQSPVIVTGELVAAAVTLAASFNDRSGDDWQRPGRRSDGAQFTVESFARYLVHDPVHHLWDVRVAPLESGDAGSAHLQS